MKICVTNIAGDVFTMEVSPELELLNFKALCEFDCGVLSQQCAVIHNGVLLKDPNKTLGAYGVKDGDMILLQQTQQLPSPQQGNPGLLNLDFSQIQVPGSSQQPRQQSQLPSLQQAQQQAAASNETDPAKIREMLLSNPHQLSLLKERNRPLADALLSGNLELFSEVLEKQRKERAERELMQIRMMNADPFDPDAQQQIAETIRLKNVEANMETAMEHAPESFGQVVMLYIDVKVNSHPVKAFVDSGAQMTIMSQACAERCNIMRLVDKRWAGIAKGVGVQKIIGRVHLGQIQIGPDFLQSSFAILEDQPMDMLLGLDMLKRHQCCIDLKNNILKIGTTGTATPFLGEAELPACARLNQSESLEKTSIETEDKQLAEALTRSAQDIAGPSTSSSETQDSLQSCPFPESTIGELTAMGFQRDEVITELRKQNGNKQMAMAALFAKNLKLPGQ
ncbi:protein DDI1 homolog 2-like [Acanthaster planci]|uniref:Protein DDI1 homolog 2-like n=1 Tax=Acanthaster planci TaxID=133434 RepID=A0A8B7YK55_ACAPL|nr:protein DDI1 homolog 2-like [Acanthaster planci]